MFLLFRVIHSFCSARYQNLVLKLLLGINITLVGRCKLLMFTFVFLLLQKLHILILIRVGVMLFPNSLAW